MTKFDTRSLLTFFMAAFVFASCDQAPSPEEPAEEIATEQVEESTVAADPETGSKPEVPEEREFQEPLLRVYREDEKIVLEGALKSRIQINRIEEQLGEAFSGTRIENQLEFDPWRYGVGWGNRVTKGFLIPYFYQVEKPSVEYDDGIITLKGESSRKVKRRVHEAAAAVFAGAGSRGIDNLIVEKE